MPTRWLVVIALGVYLALGLVPYLVSGLLVPPAAVALLLTCWAVGLATTLRLARRWPIVAPAAVGVAIAVWFAVVSVGSAVLGWTA